MRKRLAALPVLLAALAIVLCLWVGAETDRSTVQTLPYEEGIVFSITTFDGKSESKPFIKCFGHTWLSVDNQTGHSVYIKDYEIKNNEMLTFSVWAVAGMPGLLFDLEPNYIADYDRYVGRQSLSVNIGESKLKIIEDYMDRNHRWTVGKNCSYWSVHLRNEVVEEDYQLKTAGFVYTPEKIEKAFTGFDGVEVDKDFSRAGSLFYYNDGVRTELELCSQRS